MAATGKIRVAVNGYGDIGTRVADAVRLQPDMELAGVSDLATDYRVQAAVLLRLPVYAALADKAAEMRAAGIPVAGTLEDLLAKVDVVVDATPHGVGAGNLARYRAAGVKMIFQGGEQHSLTGHSFVAQANFATAVGREATRVVSCNTTGTVRTLGALRTAGLLRKARGVLIRRAADPWETDHSGIMNTLVPERHIPSHQGPDAQTILPDLDVVTMAAKAAHTHGHGHFWIAELTRAAGREEVLAAFRAASRIAFVRIADGVVALNSTIDLMQRLGRPRGDMWEVALWEDMLTVQGTEAYYAYQVDNTAIVVPETIDAIRALTGSMTDADESIRRTDAALGVRREFLVACS
jgi:glyceraldehyde-3-phosphate dehydrogenase (NAD(P))